MNKYEIRTQNKKNAIIQAALDLFNEKGFTSTSIKDIAALAHVSQVSIYNYFGNKEALVCECAKTIMKDTIKKASNILNKNISYQEKVVEALNLCESQIQLSINEYLSKVALSDPILVKTLSESIKEQKLEIYKAYIEEGKAQKEIDETISTQIYLKYMNAISNFQFSTENLEEEQRAVHQLFLYGIFK